MLAAFPTTLPDKAGPVQPQIGGAVAPRIEVAVAALPPVLIVRQGSPVRDYGPPLYVRNASLLI